MCHNLKCRDLSDWTRDYLSFTTFFLRHYLDNCITGGRDDLMAAVAVEAIPTHGEDLQSRVPIPRRSISAQVASPGREFNSTLPDDSLHSGRAQNRHCHDDNAQSAESSLPHIKLYCDRGAASPVSGTSSSMANAIDASVRGGQSRQFKEEPTVLPTVKASAIQLQCTSSGLVSECLPGIKSTGKPPLAPRPPWPMTLKSSPNAGNQTARSTPAATEYTSTGLEQSSKTSGRYTRGKGKRERPQKSEPISDSDDAPEPPEKLSKKEMCDTPSATPRLACPFFMRSPHKHFRCGSSSFKRISHVAQHLERQHYENVKCDCPICGINFDTLSGRNTHLREQRCPKRNPGLCAITTERWEEIKSVSTTRSKTQCEKWVDIYKIIVGDSTPTPLPWCTDPLEYLLRHFIGFVARSGDHSIFNVTDDIEAHSQTLSNYLADEQESIESSRQLSGRNSNFPEFSSHALISSITEGAPIFQPYRATISTPISTIPESHEANMTGLEVLSDINSYSMDLGDFSADFLDFCQHDGGALS